MKKTLTKDIIKNKLNKIYLHDVIKYGVILLLCVAYLVLYHLNPQLNIYNPKIIVLILSPIYVYLIITSIINLYRTVKAYNLTKNNKIDIIIDVLVDKNKKARFGRYRGYHYAYTFLFEKSGEYKIRKQILTISNPYDMNNKQLYDISQIDDKFYVVSVGKQKNMLVYNRKLFELKEDSRQ